MASDSVNTNVRPRLIA